MNKITKTIAGVIATFAFVAVFAASANAAYTRSLTVGSTGADVTELQTWLNSKGYLAVAPTGYFGNLTKAAVAAFQTANGITPAAGYFGPISQAKVASMGSTGGSTSTVAGCTAGALFSATTGAPCTGGSTGSTGSLAGTDGTISDVNTLSQYSNEEVGEGDEDVKIAGFEVEASNDGDIAIKSIKVSFDQYGNETGDSDHLDDYIDGVKVWFGDKEVGSANVDDFNEESDDTFSKTITLNNAVVNSDETEKFYITVDAVGSFDSSDINADSWTVAVESIRFEDGSGVVTTDTTTGDLGAAGSSIGTNGTAGDGVPFDFVTFSTAANTELKFSTDSSTPNEGVIIVDDTDNTDDVELTKGKIKVEGTSDVVLDELPVTLTSTGAGVAYVTGSLKLTIDGNDYTESVSTSTAGLTGAGLTGSITFDNLNLTLDAGKTYSFTVSADINDVDTGTFDEGSTLTASVTASNRNVADVENEEGDQLTSNERTGTATGEAQEFRTEGIQLSLVSTETSITAGNSGNDDLGTFKIKFKVKAVGDTVYVASLASTSGAALDLFTVDKSGTATTGNSIAGTITNTTDSDLSAGYNYEIEDGSEETFELIVTAQLGVGGTSGQYRAALSAVKWNTTDSSATFNSYTSNLDSFKTSYVGLN